MMKKIKMLIVLGMVLSVIGGITSMAEEMSIQNQLIFMDQYAFDNYTEFEEVKGNLKNSKIGMIDWKKEFDAKDIESVKVDTVFEDAIIKRGPVDVITFNYYGLYEIVDQKKKPEIKACVEDRNTAIFSTKWEEIEGYKNIMLTITLPNTYKEDFEFDTVSGCLLLAEGSFDAFVYDSVSGDVNVANLLGKDIEVGTTSGDFDVDNVVANTLAYSSVSGDADIEVLEAKDFTVDTTSGDLEVYMKGAKGNLTFDSISGDGDIFLDNMDNRAFEIDLLSGEYRRDFDVTKIKIEDEHRFSGQNGRGTYQINIDSLSGDMNLEKKYIIK